MMRMSQTTRIIHALCLALSVGVSGCKKEQTEEGTLNRLLGTEEADIVAPGKHIDSVLYSHGELAIWYRRMATPPGETVIMVPTGKREAAVYVFSKGNLLAAIPTDMRLPPYAPQIYPLNDTEVMVLTYVFAPEARRDPAARWHRILQVHRASASGCDKVVEHPFISMRGTDEGEMTVSVCTPFTDVHERFMLVLLEYTHESRKTKGARIYRLRNVRGILAWDENTKNFERLGSEAKEPSIQSGIE